MTADKCHRQALQKWRNFPYIFSPFPHILGWMAQLLIMTEGGFIMSDSNSRTLPPTPPIPQDLDDFIFRWESDVPPVSNR